MPDPAVRNELERWPTVSVVLPIRNEAAHLEGAVRAVLDQEYPRPFDVCLAVGPSDDGTEAIARRIAASDHRVVVVPNESGRTPAGLNAAIRATRGDVVVRVDGHSHLSPGYIRRAVETLEHSQAVNVGGVQRAVGRTPFERAVAIAMMSWLGTGGARFHVGGRAGPVDTVYLGAFRRTAGDAVGWFDETLIRNQDYELNIRLRSNGGVVWFEPSMWTEYRPRSSFKTLSRQYFEYGWWKQQVLRQHPGSAKARQLAPPMALLALACALISPKRRAALVVGSAIYGFALTVSTIRCSAPPTVRARLPLVIGCMHISWAAGFLIGGARSAIDRLRA